MPDYSHESGAYWIILYIFLGAIVLGILVIIFRRCRQGSKSSLWLDFLRELGYRDEAVLLRNADGIPQAGRSSHVQSHHYLSGVSAWRVSAIPSRLVGSGAPPNSRRSKGPTIVITANTPPSSRPASMTSSELEEDFAQRLSISSCYEQRRVPPSTSSNSNPSSAHQSLSIIPEEEVSSESTKDDDPHPTHHH